MSSTPPRGSPSSRASTRSGTNPLLRSAQRNSSLAGSSVRGSARRVRDVDEMSVGSDGGPPSPTPSGISSLGLGSLSPASRTMGSPRPRDIDMRSPLNYGTPATARTPGSTGSGTPVRHRADINTDRHLRQINIDTGGQDEPQLVIWGTNVSATEFKANFQRFIRNFREEEVLEDEVGMDFDNQQPLYVQKLNEIAVLEEPFLNINCAHIQEFSITMYRQLICYPQEVIPTMDMAVNEIFNDLHPDSTLLHQVQVRPFNADKLKTMRYLNPEDIDQLVTISGMVIRSSNIMPEMREGFFKCSVCSHGASAEIDRGRIIEPILCPNCNTNFSFTLIHNRSKFEDKQMVRLQEDLEDTPVGETPYMAALFAHGNLVNVVQPGDRITVTGIYRAAPFRLNPRMRNVRAVYKTHIDVVHFRKIDTKRLREGADSDEPQFFMAPERIEFLQELSRKPDVYERLAKAIAPSIYEHEDVKKGILLQLFGGAKKDFTNSGRGRFRSELNILLCGDPGTSKSQLLKYVFDLVPRSQYTSGKGSSAVGLTAYITKDPETRQIVLQTGALVLADNGICCIDEFDKMSDATRSILHEVMEQQTLSIAKAGIICQLNARTSVLAAANPVGSQWNTNKTIVENVNLPHTLLSRFDLIFLLLDAQSDIYDRRLAKHMISLYFQTPEEKDADFLDMSVLRDYLTYAKHCVDPQLTDEATQRLVNCYVEMRQVGARAGIISAYPRQLESLIRLSEAHAKVRLSHSVEVADVEEAFRLHKEAVRQSATDPQTGKIDLSILTQGESSTTRKRKADLKRAIKTLLEKRGKMATVNTKTMLLELRGNSSAMIQKDIYEDVIKELEQDGYLVISGKTQIRLCQ